MAPTIYLTTKPVYRTGLIAGATVDKFEYDVVTAIKRRGQRKLYVRYPCGEVAAGGCSVQNPLSMPPGMAARFMMFVLFYLKDGTAGYDAPSFASYLSAMGPIGAAPLRFMTSHASPDKLTPYHHYVLM